MEQRIQIPRINHGNCLIFRNHTLIYQITGDFQRRLGGSLSVPCLQHIQMPVLNRKLHILHIAIVIFQFITDIYKLVIYLRHNLFELVNLLRRTDSGNHVLTLCVHQEFSHQMLLPCSRVAREGNSRTGSFSHISKCHHLYIHGRSP